MRCGICLLLSAVAFAEPPPAATRAAPLKTASVPAASIDLGRTDHRRQSDVRAMFDGILHSAGLGISAGKLVLLTRSPDGHSQELAVAVGNARLTPLFDVNFRGATGVLRFAF